MILNLKQQQEILLDILKETIKICEENDITYYCQAGTVLGAIRHKGFIPWDNDVDIIIPNNQIERFVECARKQLPDKYFLDYFKGDDNSFRLFPRIGLNNVKTKELHLDVFRLIGLPDDKEKQLEIISEAKTYTLKNKKIRRPLFKMFFKLDFKCLYERLKNKKKYDQLFDELCNRYPYEQASFVMNPSGKYGEKNIFKKEVYGQGRLVDFESIKAIIPSETDFYLKQYYGDYMQVPDKKEIDRLMSKVVEI